MAEQSSRPSSDTPFLSSLAETKPIIPAAALGVLLFVAMLLGSAVVLSLPSPEASDPVATRLWWLLAGFAGVLLAGIVAVCGFAWKNLSERNALVRERAQFLATQESEFDIASDALLVLDPKGRIATMNKAAERMFERARTDVRRKDLSNLLDIGPGEEDLGARLAADSGELSAGIWREMRGRRGDGTMFPVEFSLRGIAQSRGTLMVAVAKDITERKRVERLKDEFVSTVNHELRTPLTSIAGSLGLLAGGAGGELPQGAARLIAIAHANCQRLIRLINDMLDIEKIESGKMRFDMVPLVFPEVIRRAADSLSSYASDLGVSIQFKSEGDDIGVRGDSDRIVQVATNLISNALKFSLKGSHVEILVDRVGELARLAVRDQGHGIPEEFRSRIFTKFAQADSSDSRAKGGTGLGLVIAKEIVDRHGGRLWFESKLGVGTCLYVDLPLLEEVASVEKAGIRLLVCEDDPDAGRVLREILERDGFAVDVVGSVDAAWKALASARYHTLLLDILLPDGDGVAFIRRIRANAATRDLPVIVVSAYAEDSRAQQGSAALNVVDWMDKPIDVERLRRAVREALGRVTTGRALILHVEDDADILHVTASALEDCGDVMPATSLAAARAFLAKRKPDLVVLDIGLGDGSGLELLPELTNAAGRLIPVVIFSAQDTDQLVLNQVAAVMTKSKTPLPQLAYLVRQLLAGPVRPSDESRRAAG